MSSGHKNLAAGSWDRLTLVEQLANTGSEVVRAMNWKNKGNAKYSQPAFERALELFDLTLSDPKNKKRLKEVARAREVFVAFFLGDNVYHSTEDSLRKYFYYFNYAARLGGRS